jgi:plasmid stabilization system protein ParE
MARIVFTAIAKADIRRALRFTVRRFGRSQLDEYRALMLEARKHLAENPLLGHGPQVTRDGAALQATDARMQAGLGSFEPLHFTRSTFEPTLRFRS